MIETRLSGHERKQLAIAIKSRINSACVDMFEQKRRDHLGASVIGKECMRELVYGFRWFHKVRFDGRMLRLFDRGHQEEIRIAKWLKASDFQLFGVSDDGEQTRMTGIESHYGGSLDGMIKLPPDFQLPIPFLIEMKTHNEKSFTKLLKDGVAFSKPEHIIQMNAYGEFHKLNYGIYIGVGKNDDDIHIEVIELNWEVGKEARNKASNAILATSLPNKIAATPAYFKCKFCDMAGVCHRNEPVDINCRSCRFSTPIENAQWFCRKWNNTIPKEYIPNACQEWIQFK